jgi:hypothetical protein
MKAPGTHGRAADGLRPERFVLVDQMAVKTGSGAELELATGRVS